MVTVEGLAASIASVIVCAGDEVVMPKNALIIIHDLRKNEFAGIRGSLPR